MDQGQVEINDGNYPVRLKEITDPPKKLFYEGNYSDDIFKRCVAIVGSRKMTKYGEFVTDTIVTELVSEDITVVSGFMYGIDSTAHWSAVSNGGKTIAIMAGGIKNITPPNNDNLRESILDAEGLILSEFGNDLSPKRWSFPRRNRIVAGLSSAVIVVEAEEKSGSLITANIARKYDRKVFAVPGPMFGNNSQGTNNLILQGCEIMTSVSQVVNYVNVETGMSNIDTPYTDSAFENATAERVMNFIKKHPGVSDFNLYKKIEDSPSLIAQALTELILAGYIEQKEGTFYECDS